MLVVNNLEGRKGGIIGLVKKWNGMDLEAVLGRIWRHFGILVDFQLF